MVEVSSDLIYMNQSENMIKENLWIEQKKSPRTHLTLEFIIRKVSLPIKETSLARWMKRDFFLFKINALKFISGFDYFKKIFSLPTFCLNYVSHANSPPYFISPCNWALQSRLFSHLSMSFEISKPYITLSRFGFR